MKALLTLATLSTLSALTVLPANAAEVGTSNSTSTRWTRGSGRSTYVRHENFRGIEGSFVYKGGRKVKAAGNITKFNGFETTRGTENYRFTEKSVNNSHSMFAQ